MISSMLFGFNTQDVPDDFGRILTKKNIEGILTTIRLEQKKYSISNTADIKNIQDIANENEFDDKNVVINLDGSPAGARWFRPKYRDTASSCVLRDYESGMSLHNILKKHNLSEGAFYYLKRRYDIQM